MTGVTGFTDTFNRTVANGLGTASDGHVYTITGTASQFNVSPSTGTIILNTTFTPMGLVDLQTQQVDISAQVALSAVPATNQTLVGLVVKGKTSTDNYLAALMVAASGAMSVRFSKIVANGLTTLVTNPTGVTYVAGTFYNLRFQAYWSRTLQTNYLQAKLWAVGTTEPTGWTAAATDASFTDYTAGTQVGIYARDEATVLTSKVASFRSVAVRSYSLPVPVTADTMCADPAVAFPKQTALKSLADAADAAMTTIDPLAAQAGLFGRVRISNSNFSINTTLGAAAQNPPYTAVEFNVGTSTNLGYDNTSLYLPVGIWLVTFELILGESATNYLTVAFGPGGPFIGQPFVHVRSNPVQANDFNIGGCGHVSALTYSTDPVVPIQMTAALFWQNLATTYPVRYMALSAIKISEYFT
jgi:hypothetical protein